MAQALNLLDPVAILVHLTTNILKLMAIVNLSRQVTDIGHLSPRWEKLDCGS
jgi:hypothetical protein